MEKRIEVRRQEFIDGLVALVNDAQLPAFVIGDVFRNMVAQLDQLAQVQLEQAQAEEREKE